MINYDDADKALNFMKSTDKEAARLKAYAGSLDDMKKSALALIYNDLDPKLAQGDRLKKAEGHQDYIAHLENLRKANEEHEVMKNKRNSADKQIEMWRSVNSNQRKGNI